MSEYPPSTPPATTGIRRIAREDCEPGDWVEALIAPEWTDRATRYRFRRQCVSISPQDGELGGLRMAGKPEVWTFVAAVQDGEPVWLRES